MHFLYWEPQRKLKPLKFKQAKEEEKPNDSEGEGKQANIAITYEYLKVFVSESGTISSCFFFRNVYLHKKTYIISISQKVAFQKEKSRNNRSKTKSEY